MPKKDASLIRVPLNCLIAPVTKEALTGVQNETKESQGEVVDRAVALLAFGEEIAVLGDGREAGLSRTTGQQLRVTSQDAAMAARRGIREKGDKNR